MNRACLHKIVLVTAIGAQAAFPQRGAGTRHLTLTEAVHLAVSQNRVLKIARLKVTRRRAEEGGPAIRLLPHDHEPIERAAPH